MEEYRVKPSASSQLHPFRGLFILIGFVLVGMSLGSLVAALFIIGWAQATGKEASINILDILDKPQDYEGSWYLIMAIQGVSHLITYLLPGLLYWRWIEHRRWAEFNRRPLSTGQALILVVLLTLTFMPFNGLLVEWNQNMKLPQSLAPLEAWMKHEEDKLAGLTTFLTTFGSPLKLVIALLVIGVIAAIGEEVLFRGLIQRKLLQWTSNVHVAVWVAAAIFSAIHVQFYGFIPRMVLGALFGYLYVWSGNIWVPILSHFVNNGFTVLMVWLHQQQMIGMDIENTESVTLTGALFSLILTSGLLYYFRKINQSSSLPYG